MKMTIGLMALFWMTGVCFGEMRTWTSKTGTTLEAEYVRDAVGNVWLKTPAGKQKKIPTSALSQEDQDYIYRQTLPKIKIEMDDDISRGTVGSDIDNVRQEVRCTIEVIKTSKNPYPGEYEMQYFLLGYDIRTEEYILAEKIYKKFSLSDGNKNTFSFRGERHRFEFDPDPPWGSRYEGYLVVVKTGDKILCTKGRNKYLKKIKNLRNASSRDRLDEDFKKISSKYHH
jgi:hypothetical protein